MHGAAPERPTSAGRAAALLHDRYAWAALAIFAFTAVECWTGHAIAHEVLYLLGSRRIVDPSLLAVDFTWSILPPTSFLYDHMLAPLWSFLGEFAIVTVGRIVWWALFAASLCFLGKTIRLPAGSLFAGFAAWMLWGQSFAYCGSPFEGFQVKSLAYPLIFFSIALAIRGRLVRAGIAAGVATALHIIVGGWGLAATSFGVLASGGRFSWRRVAAFSCGVVPFVLPLLIAVALFHHGAATAREQAEMDEIYVKLAAPKCCDPDTFLTPLRAARAGVLFLFAPLLVFAWPQRDGAKFLGVFLTALILFFLLGVAAHGAHLYGFLKLFPFQLANSLPALFFFIFLFAWMARGIPKTAWGKAAGSAAIAAAVWLSYDRSVLPKIAHMPGTFLTEMRRTFEEHPDDEDAVCAWIRANTPKDGVFVTPFVTSFWSRAERAQVASIRHPPFDHRLIEWKERLVAIHRGQPFTTGGYEIIPGLDYAEGALSVAELHALRTRYGATHYLVRNDRSELGLAPLYSDRGWYVYDLRGLDAAGERNDSPAGSTHR